MAALGTLLATGDSSVGSWVTDAGGTSNLYLKIDEGIAGATDTSDYIQAPNDTNNADYACTLADTPSDFVQMATLSYDIRYCLSAAPPASSKDTYGLSIRVTNGATILAAADAAGTFQSIVSTTTMATTFANKGSTAFSYVNTAADKTAWDGAVVTIRQTYTASGSKDAHAVRVSTFEITGTYSSPKNVTPGVGAITLTGKAPSLGRNPAKGVLTVTGYAPVVKTPVELKAKVGAISLTGFAPSVAFPKVVLPLTGAMTVTGVAPTVQVPREMKPASGTLTLTGIAPEWSLGPGITSDPQEVFPASGTLTFTSYAPRIVLILPTQVGGAAWPSAWPQRRVRRTPPKKRKPLPAFVAMWAAEFVQDDDS